MKEVPVLSNESCERLLKENILSYWMNRMLDERHGGFLGRIDGNDQEHPEADKGVILNTRILWTFSAAYNQIKEPEYLRMASRAYAYLTEFFVDQEQGGVYWMLDVKGNVKDSKKQIYALAFAIYALVEYHKASQDKEALEQAISLFELIEKHSFDAAKNGYMEAYDRNWNLLQDLRLSDKDANEAKTMNTHLHVMEAYTTLYEVWPNEILKGQLRNLIEMFLDRFIDPSGHFHLFFDEDWKLKSHHFSYGHDIEGGWLLVRAAEVLADDELLKRANQAALLLTDGALKGMDTDGGLMNEGDSDRVLDTDKHWWPQAEALIGLQSAYEISGKAEYLRLRDLNWQFIHTHIIDVECGEWHWMVHKEGQINRKEDKAGPWKCPYHNGRAMLELMTRIAK